MPTHDRANGYANHEMCRAHYSPTPRTRRSYSRNKQHRRTLARGSFMMHISVSQIHVCSQHNTIRNGTTIIHSRVPPHTFSHPNGYKPCTVHYRPKLNSAIGPRATDAQDATHANAATMHNGHTRHDARTNACRIRNNEKPTHATCLALYPAFKRGVSYWRWPV